MRSFCNTRSPLSEFSKSLIMMMMLRLMLLLLMMKLMMMKRLTLISQCANSSKLVSSPFVSTKSKSEKSFVCYPGLIKSNCAQVSIDHNVDDDDGEDDDDDGGDGDD